jgi:hypothetical protein
MSTYTGSLDAVPVSLTTQPGQVYPDDRQGTFVEINALPSGAIIDNIFYFNSPNSGKYLKRVIDGVMRAAYCGIYPDGTDQSAKLQAAIDSNKIQEIVFDYPGGGVIIINGTVNVPQGKVIRFEAGNRLSGTGTINGGIIHASYYQQIIEPTLTVNPAGVTGTMVSAKWFGATGTEAIDNAPLIQEVINMVVRNSSLPRDIYFPPGIYRCDGPVIIYSWNGSNYIACTANLVGNGSAQGANPVDTAILKFNQKNTFGIGIQRGYSCLIEGLTVTGPFNPSFGDAYNFYTSDFATYATADGMRDKPYSPNAGIVIDPFRFEATIPFEDAYPGYFDWYRGTGGGISHAGSSYCIIRECRVYGFTVDICISPNGVTQQAEDCQVESCTLEVAKVAYSSGQRQTKGNTIRNCRSWDRVHTFLDVVSYGIGAGGHGTPPCIAGLNIAGTVKRVFNVTVQHPVCFENIYCESLGEIGTLVADAGTIAVRNSNFDLNTNTRYVPTMHVNAYNVEFQSCTIRYYDDLFNKRIFVNGFGNTFQNCWFDVVPLTDSAIYSQQAQVVAYLNCRSGQNVFFGFDQYMGQTQALNRQFLAYGNMQFTDQGPVVNSPSGAVLDTITIRINVPSHQYSPTIAYNVTVTVNNAAASASFTSSYLATYGRLGDYVVSIDSAQHVAGVIGRITAIDRTTGVVSLSEVPYTTGSGQYNIGYNTIRYIKQAFIGDITAGSNTITNVEYSYSFSTTPYGVGDFCPLIGGIITNVNTSAKTITSTAVSSVTAQGMYSGFYTPFPDLEEYLIVSVFEPGYSSVTAAYDKLIPPNAIWTVPPSPYSQPGGVRRWTFTKGGYLSPATVSRIHQAEFIVSMPDNAVSGSGTSNFSLTVGQNYIIEGIVLKATANMSINIGTTPGGTQIGASVALAANVSQVVSYSAFTDALTNIYFSNVSGGTLTARALLKPVAVTI